MVKSGTNPPEYITQIAASISNLMDAQTDALLRSGMLSEEAANRWRGHYLPRIYLKQTTLFDEAKKEVDKLFGQRFGSAVRGMTGKHMLGRGIFKTVVGWNAVSQYKQLGWEVRDPNWNDAQGELQFKGDGAEPSVPTVVMWRDFTPEERAQMGEERDSMVRLALGYMQSQEDIALANFFKSLSENTEFSSNIYHEGWELVPKTTIGEGSSLYRYGALAGKYVSPRVWTHLEHYEEHTNSVASRMFKSFMSAWKEGKTALNPVSHLNNTVGNVIFAHFAGVNAWDARSYYDAFEGIYQNSKEYQEAEKAGLFSGSFSRTEIMEMIPLESVRNKLIGAKPAYEKLFNLFLDFGSLGLRKKLRRAYEFEDEFFKFLIYRNARKNGADAKDAVDYANQFIFAYDDLPSGAKALRNTVLPFFSWTYKAIPVLVHTAMVYPHRFLMPATILFAANKAMYMFLASMQGAGDDDFWTLWQKASKLQDAEQAALPEQGKGYSIFGTPKFLRLWNNTDGSANFLDITRMIPGGDFLDFNNQSGGLPIPQWLMPNSPQLSLFSSMFVNKDLFLGKEIVKDTDSDAEAFKKRLGYMYLTLSPALAVGGYHVNRLINAIAAETGTEFSTPLFDYTGRDWQGREMEFGRALAHTFGVKVKPYDLESEADRQIGRMRSEIRELQTQIRYQAKARNRGAISDMSFRSFVSKTRDDIQERVEKILKYRDLTEPIRK